MKSTGIARQIDELGRFVLPVEIRRSLNINLKDYLEIYTEQDRIIAEFIQIVPLNDITAAGGLP